MEMFVQSLVNGLVFGAVLALIALGLTLIFGIMNLVNFAHGELYMLGAFGFWLLFSNSAFNGVPLYVRYAVAIIVSTLAVTILGMVFERFILRRFTGQFLPAAQTCIGLILILQVSALLTFGSQLKTVDSPFDGKILFGGFTLSVERVVVALMGVALTVALWAFLKWTKIGRSMRAVAQDADAAAFQGIDIGRVSGIAFGISAALAAAAGGIVAPLFYIDPYIGGPWVMIAFAVTIIGGLGSIFGTIVAALIVGLIQSFGSTYLGPPIANLLIFLLMIVFLMVRPKGIWGHA